MKSPRAALVTRVTRLVDLVDSTGAKSWSKESLRSPQSKVFDFEIFDV